jgi:hypothetical protein
MQVMLSYFSSVKDRAQQGEFTISGGYQMLKLAITKVESYYKMASEAQELGPRFNQVLLRFQQQEVVINFLN